MFTNAGSDAAFILRITWPRWAFTVISLIPSSPPTCLFKSPETTSSHDFTLARRERCVALAQLPHLRLVFQGSATALERMLDGAEQHVTAAGLGQELVGSRLHRLHARADVAVPGDENDGRRPADRQRCASEDPGRSGPAERHRGPGSSAPRTVDEPGTPARTRMFRAPSLPSRSAVPATRALRRRDRQRTPRALLPMRAASWRQVLSIAVIVLMSVLLASFSPLQSGQHSSWTSCSRPEDV